MTALSKRTDRDIVIELKSQMPKIYKDKIEDTYLLARTQGKTKIGALRIVRKKFRVKLY